MERNESENHSETKKNIQILLLPHVASVLITETNGI